MLQQLRKVPSREQPIIIFFIFLEVNSVKSSNEVLLININIIKYYLLIFKVTKQYNC